MVERQETEQFPKSEFVAKLEARWSQGHFVCVGLDSEFEKMPDHIKGLSSLQSEAVAEFNFQIVEATHDLVCAYKPNIAFYEALGRDGFSALFRTILHIRREYPEIPVILDAKRADIGNTNVGYVKAAFDELGADAITVHPYLGKEALKPFLDRKDKGIIVLCRTSNPGAGEFQDLEIREQGELLPKPGYRVPPILLYEYVAQKVAESWNENGNCALVVGATYPQELAKVRRIVGDIPILIPGIGAQGGEVLTTVKAGMNSKKQGMIINSSRGIIFASSGEDFSEAARKATQTLHDQINQYRNV